SSDVCSSDLGVINIITRRNFEGAEANAYFGQYDQGDGQKQTYDFVIGMAGERGSLTIGAEYHKEDAVWARDRWFSNDSYPGYPQYSNSVVGKWGNFNANTSRYLRNGAGQLIMLDDDDNEIILDPSNPDHVPVLAGAQWY